jgi:predicted transcriptional regulator
MPVATIKIDRKKQSRLKSIAMKNGKSLDALVDELLRDFIKKQEKAKKSEKRELHAIMKLSERSFSEWDNEEDAVYDRL